MYGILVCDALDLDAMRTKDPGLLTSTVGIRKTPFQVVFSRRFSLIDILASKGYP